MEEITRFVNLPVYTIQGTYVGNVKNVILDVANARLDSLLVGKTNPALIEGGVDVAVPYRWVRDFDDILILNHFPQRVALPIEEGDMEEVDEVEETAPTA